MYNFDDKVPASGINYYRLNQIDLDGKNEYSEIRSVDMGELPTLEVFPSLVKTGAEINIKLSGISNINGSLTIYDLNGQVMFYKDITSNVFIPNITVDTENWSSGIYVSVFSNGVQTMNQRIVIADKE